MQATPPTPEVEHLVSCTFILAEERGNDKIYGSRSAIHPNDESHSVHLTGEIIALRSHMA